jgi:ketosteroid isomerase-like protein
MSQEEVEIRNEVVRRFTETFESDTDAFRDTLHPEIEWFPIEENHTPTYGVEGAMRLRNQWLDTWDEHRIEVEEVVEEGDSVVALAHVTARGKASGVEVDLRLHYQFKVRDDKVVYLFEHEDRAAALEAAGLRE